MIESLARSMGVVRVVWVMLMIMGLAGSMSVVGMVETMLMIVSLTGSMGVVSIVWVMLMMVGLTRSVGVVGVVWVMLMIVSLDGCVGVVMNMLHTISSSSRRNCFAFPEDFQAFCKLKKKSVNIFQLCHFLAFWSRPALFLKKVTLRISEGRKKTTLKKATVQRYSEKLLFWKIQKKFTN